MLFFFDFSVAESKVSDGKLLLATPAGSVPRLRCYVPPWGGLDVHHGSKLQAFQELKEETGIRLDELEDISEVFELKASQAHSGCHMNFGVLMSLLRLSLIHI